MNVLLRSDQASYHKVSFRFFPKGGGGGGEQNDTVWIIGGQVCIHVQNMWQSRGVRGHAPPRKFDFGPFIRRNLVESGIVLHKHNLPSFIIDLRVK